MKSSLKYLITFSIILHNQTSSADGLNDWQLMVGASKEAQPHWITPIATVTPRLEQEILLTHPLENQFASTCIRRHVY